MIISQTPYRVSLFGGGTDLPIFYKKYEGKVIGFTINKYSYLFLKRIKPMLGWKYRIVYSNTETVNSINKIQHPSVKETIKYYNFKDYFELTHNGDLPALSGMGSSSSFTVGLCNIVQTLKKKKINKYQLAYDAIDIEQNKIKESVGSQDQVFASFGGINKIEFKKNGLFKVKQIFLTPKNLKLLEASSLLIFTGKVRYASKIEKKKIKLINQSIIKQNMLQKMKQMVDKCEKAFQQKKINIKEIGEMLNESWKIKKKLSKDISNRKIDIVYKKAMENGAYGGKLLGAGGGGFLFFLCNPNKRNKIIKALSLNVVNFKIDQKGSEIIFAPNE
jgi:D-glycero-alpha-D-manno-heptose-7-phosphate kinase